MWIHFDEPVVGIKLKLSGFGNKPIVLNAYTSNELYPNSPVAQITSTAPMQPLTLMTDFLTAISVNLDFQKLLSLECMPRDTALNANWHYLKGIGLLHTVTDTDNMPPSEARKIVSQWPGEDDNARKNYYVSSLDEAISRYSPGLSQLVWWQKKLIENPNDSIDSPNLNSVLESGLVKPKDTSNPLKEVELQSLMLLAAHDPNIARLLSLYWVDCHSDAMQTALGKGGYDYKIVGRWSNRKYAGLVFGINESTVGRPTVGPVTGRQVAGIRWEDSKAHGRVGLRWERGEDSSHPATRAVLYDIEREIENATPHGPVALTKTHPVLVPKSSWPDPQAMFFVDRKILIREVPNAVARCQYEVRGIDLFGQVGESSTSDWIEVRDLEAPPPPVHLRADLKQAGYPWLTQEERNQAGSVAELSIHFEYGEFQRRQAPDAKRFQLYWRADSVSDHFRVNVIQLSSEFLGGSGTYYYKEVKLEPVEGPNLSTYTYGVIKKEKTRYYIERVADSPERWYLTVPAGFSAGVYEFISDPHDQDRWTKLATETEIDDVVEGQCTWEPPFQITAKQIQVREPQPNPLSMMPPGTGAADLSTTPAYQEVFIDRRLLTPDTLKDWQISGTASKVKVIYSTQGPAFDGNNGNIAARIGIPVDYQVRQDDKLALSPPEELLSLPPDLDNDGDCFVCIKAQFATLNNLAKDLGGELAFDSETTHIARVVSEFAETAPSSGEYRVLLRLVGDIPTALAALKNGVLNCRYYTPYSQALTIHHTGTPDINLTIPPDSSVRQVYIAVSTVDSRDNEGPLSVSVQATLVKPPPNGRPDEPYPCGDEGATSGYATPPDIQGRATVCLQWKTDDLDPLQGLRYEVARALDSGIIAADKRRWLTSEEDGNGDALEGDVRTVAPEIDSGTYLIGVEVSAGDYKVSKYKGGRLTSTLDTTTARFQITGAAQLSPTTLEFRIRPLENLTPVPGYPCEIQAPPNYKPLKDDMAALKALALQNPDAFSLVTGVPIAETIFTDEIPGKGRNCFFYRVRAVDPAGNYTKWSDINAPFYQVDTTPPTTPQEFKVTPGDRCAELSWLPPRELRPDDPQVVRYRIYRIEGEADHFRPLMAQPYQTIALEDTSPRRLRVVGGKVVLPQPLLDVDQAEIGLQITPDPLESFVPVDIGTLSLSVVAHVISGVNPLVPDDTQVTVSAGPANSRRTFTHRPGSTLPLTVTQGRVDLTYPFAIAGVLGVYEARFMPPGTSTPPPIARNLFSASGVYISALVINGLRGHIADDTEVVVLVRSPDGQRHIVRYAPGTLDPLVVESGRIRLLPELKDSSSVAVKAVQIQMLDVSRLDSEVPDGTFVKVILTHSGEEHIITSDPSKQTWFDRGLIGGERYAYWLIAVKQVKSAPKDGSGTPEIVTILSRPTNAVTVTGLDRSIPEPPIIQELKWVDHDTGADAIASTETAEVHLVVEVNPDTTAEVLIQHQLANGEEVWRSAPLLGERGWVVWNSGETSREFTDRVAGRTETHRYRAMLRTIDGRCSIPSAISSVNPI